MKGSKSRSTTSIIKQNMPQRKQAPGEASNKRKRGRPSTGKMAERKRQQDEYERYLTQERPRPAKQSKPSINPLWKYVGQPTAGPDGETVYACRNIVTNPAKPGYRKPCVWRHIVKGDSNTSRMNKHFRVYHPTLYFQIQRGENPPTITEELALPPRGDGGDEVGTGAERTEERKRAYAAMGK